MPDKSEGRYKAVKIKKTEAPHTLPKTHVQCKKGKEKGQRAGYSPNIVSNSKKIGPQK